MGKLALQSMSSPPGRGSAASHRDSSTATPKDLRIPDEMYEELRDEQQSSRRSTVDASKARQLLLSFLAMVFIGLGNKLFQKFQTGPMYHYPFLLNLLTTFIYVPLSFAYIVPIIKWGDGTIITEEMRAIKQWDFFVMGTLDGIAGVLQMFCATYITSG